MDTMNANITIITEADIIQAQEFVERRCGPETANLWRADREKLLAKIRICELERDGDDEELPEAITLQVNNASHRQKRRF